MRASRLVGLLGLLQARGRMTAPQLAAELEVSQRTIARDIEALGSAGIPVYAVRGRLGGYALLDGFSSELPAGYKRGQLPPTARGQRALVRLSPAGRRLAALTGRPAGLRVRRNARPPGGREDWTEARVRIDSVEAAVPDILTLGAEIEVIWPAELRALMRETAARIAELHSDDGAAGAGPAGGGA